MVLPRVSSRTLLLTVSMSFIMLGGCTPPSSSAPSASDSPDAIIAAARARYEASHAAGHAWRKTGVHLEAAEAALATGDVATARSEAERATALAEASLAQARDEADAWKTRMPGT